MLKSKQLWVAVRRETSFRKLHPFERLSVELALTHHWNKVPQLPQLPLPKPIRLGTCLHRLLQTGVAFGKILACMEHSCHYNLSQISCRSLCQGLKQLRTQIHEIGTHRANLAMVVHISVVKVWKSLTLSALQAERGRLATFIADEGIEDCVEFGTSMSWSFCGKQQKSFGFWNDTMLFLLKFMANAPISPKKPREEIFDLVTNWEPVFQQFIGCQQVWETC